MIALPEFMRHLAKDNNGEYCLGELAWTSGDFVAVLTFGALDVYNDCYTADDCDEAFNLVLDAWSKLSGVELEYDFRYGTVFFNEDSEDTINRFVDNGGIDLMAELEDNPDWREVLEDAIA